MEDSTQQYVLKMRIGFIGGGNMCKAIVAGLLTKFKPENISVYGPHPEKLECFKQQGIIVASTLSELVNSSSIIFLSVKPIMLAQVRRELEECVPTVSSKRYIISILAGTTLSQVKEALSVFTNGSFIRIMPNTPMMVGHGSVVYSLQSNADFSRYLITFLMGCCSKVCEEIPERLINAAAAVSGSGPAYGYLMIEALADGGVKMGLPRELAMKLAAHTLIGASKMVLETGKHPGLLKDEVCSPGGTTIEGMHALERGGVRNSLMTAVEAATNKAIQMERP